jgi:pyruvate dehydrogenase E1 component
MRERRMALGGFLPQRRRKAAPLECRRCRLRRCSEGSGEGRELSTTMAIVRILNMLLKDKKSAARRADRARRSRAPSAWKACSARSASGTRQARTTCRKTMTS